MNDIVDWCTDTFVGLLGGAIAVSIVIAAFWGIMLLVKILA
jgi:hypothetical protein